MEFNLALGQLRLKSHLLHVIQAGQGADVCTDVEQKNKDENSFKGSRDNKLFIRCESPEYIIINK